MKIYMLCFVMTMVNRGRLQIHAMVIVICMGMGIHGALEGLKYIDSGGGHKVVAPPSIGDNNYLAMATLMVMPLLVYLFRYSESRLIRFSFIGALLACFAGVVATASRGGTVGLAVLGLFLIWHSRRKMLSLLVVASLAGALMSYAPQQWLERMDTITAATESDSFMTRVSSWKLNTIMALDRPLVGGSYSALENWAIFDIYKLKFHRLDGIIASPEPTIAFAAHSIYFQTLGDLGFPGLFLFMGILFTGFRNIHHVLRYTRNDESLIWARDLAVLFRLSLIVFMVCGALLSAAYFELLYIMLTQVSVLRHHLEETTVAATRPRPVYLPAAPNAAVGLPVG